MLVLTIARFPRLRPGRCRCWSAPGLLHSTTRRNVGLKRVHYFKPLISHINGLGNVIYHGFEMNALISNPCFLTIQQDERAAKEGLIDLSSPE